MIRKKILTIFCRKFSCFLWNIKNSFNPFLLNGIWWFVVRGSWFVVVVFYVPTLQYCSTDLLYMCGCAVNKTPGGPRAQEGTRTTGNTRALTHGHLKAVHRCAKNTRQLFRSKHIAPEPRIARAPELVSLVQSTTVVLW